MLKSEINTNTIKHKYTKIYNFFFKYLIYFIIFLFWLVIIVQTLNKNEIFDLNNNFMIEKVKLIWEFNKKLKQQMDNNDIQIYITNWNLESNDELLLSIDNLISYKWFILPKNVFIYQTSPIKNIDYFNTDNYDIKELKNIASNTIFTNLEKIEKSLTNNISLPINDSIENTFYTKCITQKSIFNKTCDYYTTNFIDTFFIYNISKDYGGLIKIFDSLEKTKYKKDFCEWLKKYILYSKDTNNELGKVFTKCWNEYFKIFQDLKLFIDIQSQLNKWYINYSVDENINLNAYKLLSYQQIIYNDLNQNIIDNIRFESYFNYLKNILKNPNKIESVYIDLTYRLNNNYITNVLNKSKYQVSERKKIEIENIIKWLNVINNWSSLEWYVWLKPLLTNKNLEKPLENDDMIKYTEWSEISITLSNLKSLSFLKILNEKVSEDKIKISGYFSIKLKDWYLPLYLWFSIDKNWNIESININEYEDLNQTIWNITKQRKYSITEIYQYIQNNINIFLSSERLSTCEIILYKLKDYTENNKQIIYIDLENCNDKSINIIKEEKIDKEVYKINYKISLENFNIKDIKISDQRLENEIRKYLQNINTNHITIPNIIQEIISYKKEEINTKQEWSNNIIITIEDFERHFSTIPKDISESNWQIKIEFSIKNINFIWLYSVDNKILWPIYLKQANTITQNDNTNIEELLINNLKLILKEENQNEINKFIIDPFSYITKLDPNIIQNYGNIQ